MSASYSCCAILVAAGSSTRMSCCSSKQFIPLLEVPAIAHSLSAFEKAQLIQEIIVVCRPEDREEMLNIIRQYHIKKVRAVVPGGKTRQQSVSAGILAASEHATYFAIHDGARPLIQPQAIDAVVQDAFLHKASALGTPVKDTIKIIDENGFVVSTPNRASLWAVQTPQVFERELYLSAMKQAEEESADYTDDCQLVEHFGVKVHLCLGEYTNLKLTTQEDIAFAEAILETCRNEAEK
ncbi:MAG TPA: 2-C-methyl-D-erythritol 4-phosphate cytidylyltransferase [Oscillospiraceae bacterium]|nr:2-C-methyl-D-erythritol 4-phosphate cytidylyltransferase [Oscillospiraceae bacterium]